MSKLFIRNRYLIDIVIQVDPLFNHILDEIVAVNLKHPSSKNKLTNEELLIYSDIIDSMLSPIEAHDFRIVKQRQASNSYSYYVHFYPKTLDGVELDEVLIIFRLSNHPMDGDEGQHKKSFVKSFIINNILCASYLDLMNRVSDLCDQLQEGNYDALLTKLTPYEIL